MDTLAHDLPPLVPPPPNGNAFAIANLPPSPPERTLSWFDCCMVVIVVAILVSTILIGCIWLSALVVPHTYATSPRHGDGAVAMHHLCAHFPYSTSCIVDYDAASCKARTCHESLVMQGIAMRRSYMGKYAYETLMWPLSELLVPFFYPDYAGPLEEMTRCQERCMEPPQRKWIVPFTITIVASALLVYSMFGWAPLSYYMSQLVGIRQLTEALRRKKNR